MNQESNSTTSRQVKFTIPQTVMTITTFVEQGFDRRYVVALFEELESKGFGQYVKGHRGRTGASKFIPALDVCPQEYTITVEQKKRGRKPTAKQIVE